MAHRGQFGYLISPSGRFVESLVVRATDSDVAEAAEPIATVEATPADGSVIRDLWVYGRAHCWRVPSATKPPIET